MKSKTTGTEEVRTYQTDKDAEQAFEKLQENGASPTLTKDHGDGEITVVFDKEVYKETRKIRGE